MQQGTIERWLQSARRNAEIVDNRDNFGAS